MSAMETTGIARVDATCFMQRQMVFTARIVESGNMGSNHVFCGVQP